MAPPRPQDAAPGGGWTIERAEQLLRSLMGVVSARVVARPGGEIQEIHLLTDEEVGAKQTVRNVESALLAEFDLVVDHRKISVAQTRDPAVDRKNGGGHGPPAAREGRILFLGHRVEPAQAHRVRMHVQVEWQGKRFEGDAAGADLPRNRLETVAHATLRGVESAVAAGRRDDQPGLALELDGVRIVEAFERRYALVSVHALGGREVRRLSGAAVVEDTPDRAVIMATLQATDRWVRGRLKE